MASESAASLVRELISEGVYLYLEGSDLKYRSRKGAFTDQHKQAVKHNRQDIIRYLAELNEQETGVKESVPELKPQTHPEHIPLSFSQRRLWFVDRLGQGSTQFNMHQTMELGGQFNGSAFSNAVNDVVTRHQILRTRYEERDGDVFQVVDECVDLPIQWHDFTRNTEQQRDARLREIRQYELGCPFDLSTGPMIRIHHVQVSSDVQLALYTIHHIACDGWSLHLFSQELRNFYDLRRENVVHDIPQLTVNYSDYAIWQRAWLTDDVIEEQLRYWRKQLDGVPMVHSLPLDSVRPARQTHLGSVLQTHIGSELANTIRAACERLNVTLFMFMHTVFTILLAKYSNERDIVIGSPIAGRNSDLTENLIGFFVNTLVLRTQVKPSMTFTELLETNKKMVLTAYDYQHIPFEKLVEELAPDRHLSHNSIVQISFGVQKIESDHSQRELSVSQSRVQSPVSSDSEINLPFELKLDVYDHDRSMSFAWFYNVGLFGGRSIARMASSFNRLLENICDNLSNSDDSSVIGQLNWLDVLEQNKVVHEWNSHTVEHPVKQQVHELFENWVLKSPGALAILHGEDRITYEALDERSNQLARLLHDEGVGPGYTVALLLPRCVDMVVALLATLKTGAAYVPIDITYPSSRIKFILDDCCPFVAISHTSVVQQLPLDAIRTVALDDPELNQRIQSYDASGYPPSIGGNGHAAYMIYTSGSTGQPKGTVLSHRSVSEFLRQAVESFVEEHVVGAVVSTTLAFDATVGSLLVALVSGKYIDLLPEGPDMIDALRERLMHSEQALLFKVTPSHLEAVAGHVPAGVVSDTRHVLVVAGEPFYPSLLSNWQTNLLPDAVYFNEYGPTEAAVGSTLWKVSPGSGDHQQSSLPGRTVPIGFPMGDTQLYVLNDWMLPQAIGCVGELYIGGQGLADGYLNKSAMTAERFVPNPFSRCKQRSRLYRTGDLVRYREDGALEFISRVDNQIKLRGYRVELGEIEAQILQIGPVSEVAVVVVGSSASDQRLVAYLAPEREWLSTQSELHSDQTPAKRHEEESDRELIQEVQKRLKPLLPMFMVPNHFVVVDSLPKTPNGKIDRMALRKRTPISNHSNLYVAPRNAMEEALCSIWETEIGVDQVGVHDNFFALGGHSLLAIKVIAAVRGELGVELPIRLLFEGPTVAEMAEQLAEQNEYAVLPPIELVNRDEPLLLSYSQQRLYFIDQLQGGSTQFNMPGYFLIDEVVDQGSMEHAFGALLTRHEVLRTHFDSSNDVPQQVVKSEFDVVIPRVDLRNTSSEQLAERIQVLVDELTSRPFDLGSDLMVRATLLDLPQEKTLFVYVVHHIASDGVSRRIIERDLSEHYSAHTQEREPNLVELPVQYADYAGWQRTWLAAYHLQDSLEYWKQQLADIPTLSGLPLDKVRPTEQRYRGKSLHTLIDQTVADDIRTLCRNNNCTVFMFMQTALALILSRFSGDQDIVVGTAINGRHHLATADLVGFFINDLVIRTKIADNVTFNELLNQQKDTILSAYANQHVPFEMLVEELNPQRSMSHSPIFQVKIDERARGQAVSTEANSSFTDLTNSSPVDGASSPAEHNVKHDLYLSFSDETGPVSLYWLYNSDLFFDDTITRLSEHFTMLLREIVRSPDNRVFAFPILTQPQTTRYLEQWDKTAASKVSSPVHHLIEATADHHPAAVAVRYVEDTITYQELNEQANQLANFLIAKGITCEQPVALCLEPSIDTIVAILAVMKSGGAFVPLQATLPQDRIDTILDDCGCEWVLTQSELIADISFSSCRVLPIDEVARANLLSQFSDENPPESEDAHVNEQLAYVIYTSGSTGKPKGVMIEHHSLSEYCSYAMRLYYAEHLSGSLVASSYGFDLTLPSLLLPLVAGDTVVILPDDDVIGRLSECLASCEESYLIRATPSHIHGVLPSLSDCDDSSKHAFVVGGEALPPSIYNGLRRVFPQSRIVNHYGPTEAIIGCCSSQLSEDSKNEDRSHLPIGRAMEHTSLLVLNGAMQICPVGVTGELYIGGRLARGYLGQPGLTSDRFVQNPFSSVSGQRLYRTGDLARVQSDGQLYYEGRIDAQVKVRGMRIELGEIESELAMLNGINACCVDVKVVGEEPQLISYIVLEDKSLIEAEEEAEVVQRKQRLVSAYRKALLLNLPHYMVAQIFIFLPELPLSANGKLDRSRLPMPREEDLMKSRYVAPGNETEAALCALWEDVLSLEQVGVEDDFFLLGGHSLLATKLINLIRRQFDIEISLRVLFEKTTISELAPEVTAHVIERKLRENRERLDDSDDIEEIYFD